MGWTSMQKPHNVAEWLREQLTWSSADMFSRVLDLAIVNRTEAYAAVETIRKDGSREVWAAVYLLKFAPKDRGGYTFSYKDMSEHAGPYATSCPARILELLTPTDSEYANEWRRACRDRLARRAANVLNDGDYVCFSNPYYFADYGAVSLFRYAKHGRMGRFQALDLEGTFLFNCRLPNWRDRELRKVPAEEIAALREVPPSGLRM